MHGKFAWFYIARTLRTLQQFAFTGIKFSLQNIFSPGGFSGYDGSVLLRDFILNNKYVFLANTAQVDSFFSCQFIRVRQFK